MQIKSTTVREPRELRQVIASIILLALMPVLVAGCRRDEPGPQVAEWTLIDPEQRHPILVSQQPANLNLHVATGSQGLSPAQRVRVMEFVSRNRAVDAGNSRFVISAPGGSANEGAAMEAADEVRRLMLAGGYSETAISVEPYRAGSGEAPLRVSYLRYVAEAPDCGQDWSENLARSYQNLPYPNYGCAAQRNLAVMVANPADLLGPRTMSARDSSRRDVVYDRYVKGEPTGAAPEVLSVQKLNANN